MKVSVWTQEQGIALCVKIEQILVKRNLSCHVALTGGLLYGGTGKDMDLVFYPHRNPESGEEKDIDVSLVFTELRPLGIYSMHYYRRIVKCIYHHKKKQYGIDCFFPGRTFITEDSTDSNTWEVDV